MDARIRRLLLLPALLASSGCTGPVSSIFADAVLYPERQPLKKTPHDYGMDYQDVQFQSADGVDLKGWLLPGSADKLVVITHPGSFSRYGLSVKDQKGWEKFSTFEVEFLTTARQLHQAGYWVLMFDFRNHGESGRSPNGGITGLGIWEYQDVVAAVRYARGREDTRNLAIGFVSFCQGADATIIALSRAKDELQASGVKCLVAVQPISMKTFIHQYAKATAKDPDVIEETERKCVARGGLPWAEMSPGPFVQDVFVPTLYVQAREDPWSDLSELQDFYDRTPAPKELFFLEGKLHRFDTYNYFGTHPEKLLEFLSRNL